ncbi:SPOSA6832_02755, partial [Sporobolomyces salmonicolor]
MPRPAVDKERRRSSFAPPGTPPRAPAGAHLGHGREPKMAVLAAANRLRDQQSTPGRNVSGVLGAAPLVVESQRYEEWMKIATDNKITSTNTWNLALIDYFHDMSLLRDGDDNSINFQKASCTLDGCVKIWTSRVDSVATETGKLLSGLGEDAHTQGDDDLNDDGDDDDDEREARKAKKRVGPSPIPSLLPSLTTPRLPQAARAAATLADDFSKIRVKQFDLEFTVDPLFKKTSADFDEGGAGGILMNHLGCDGNMKVVFDAGDAKLECDEEDEDDEQEEEEEEEGVEVDIGKLRERCIPFGLSTLSSMTLCPSLSAFRFSADSNLDLDLLNLSLNDDEDDHPARSAQINGHLAAEDDDFGGFQDHFAGQDFGGGGEDDAGRGGEALPDGDVDFFADQFTGGNVGAGMGTGMGGAGGPAFGAVEDFDPRRMPGERDLVMTRKEKTAFALDFSVAPLVSSKELFAPANPKSSITSSAVSRSRTRRSTTATNGSAGEEDHTLPDDYHFNSQVLLRLFLKPRTTVRHPPALPSPVFQLIRRCREQLKMRRRGVQSHQLAGNGDDDVQFWAQAGGFGAGDGGDGFAGEGEDYGGFQDHFAGQDFGGGACRALPACFDIRGVTLMSRGVGCAGAGGDTNDDDDDPPPFDTQWLAGGDADFDDADPAGDDVPDDLAAATQGQLRRVRPETVNYAKRAKRVDVKRLKDSIWRELEEVAVPVKELMKGPTPRQYPNSLVYEPATPPPELTLSDSDDTPAPPVAVDRKPRPAGEALVPVVSSLRRLYPAEKMSEISTSYMFICLLHLANEKGLRIQTPAAAFDDGEDEGNAARRSVGGLEGLRVLREVGAA